MSSRRVRMTRRVSFSSGHRLWLDNLDERANRALFGKWAGRFNHGHNYALEVTVEGPVDAATGMVLNIKRIDDLLKGSLLPLVEGKSLNDEVPAFKDRPPTVENLMLWIWEFLAAHPLPPDVSFDRVRLEETPLLYGEFDGQTMTLTRVYEFAASHRLHSSALSDGENLALFGKCNNPAGHGHNYVLEVTVEGKPDPRTGMLVNIDALDRLVSGQVLTKYDHKNLNMDVKDLEDVVPTSENVAIAIFASLQENLPGLVRVRLHETSRNAFEVEKN